MTSPRPLLPAAPRESKARAPLGPAPQHLKRHRAPHQRDQRLLGWLSWRRKRRLVHQRTTLDAVVSGRGDAGALVYYGDLTHIGHEHELSEALAWLSLGDGERVSVIPGNHDVYIKLLPALPTRLWAPYLPDPEAPGHAFSSAAPWP